MPSAVVSGSVIRWEDPPPSASNIPVGGVPGSRWDEVAAVLSRNPGRWALIAEDLKQGSAASLANVIRRGAYVCFEPRGDFDAVCRSSGGVAKVYARYLGDGAA